MVIMRFFFFFLPCMHEQQKSGPRLENQDFSLLTLIFSGSMGLGWEMVGTEGYWVARKYPYLWKTVHIPNCIQIDNQALAGACLSAAATDHILPGCNFSVPLVFELLV